MKVLKEMRLNDKSLRVNNARERALDTWLYDMYKDKIMDDWECVDDLLPDYVKDEFASYVAKRNDVGRYPYCMVTINFKEDVTFADAVKKFNKFVKKCWILKSMSCFEWRDIDKGMHIHSKLWIAKDKRYCECHREIYNTFKHLVGNKRHVCLRPSTRDGCFEDYIKGIKEGSKKATHDIDKEMRIKYAVSNVITIE